MMPVRNIYSWLSRCCTARGSRVYVLLGGPSKVGSCKLCFNHYTLNQGSSVHLKNPYVFAKFCIQFFAFSSFFQLFSIKTLKNHTLISVCSVQHPNTGQNIQHTLYFTSLRFASTRTSCFYPQISKKCIPQKLDLTKTILRIFIDFFVYSFGWILCLRYWILDICGDKRS